MKTVSSILLMIVASTGCMSRHSERPEDPFPPGEREIYCFAQNADPRCWEIQNDGSGGGCPHGTLAINEAGNAVFSGRLGREADGGCSSMRHEFEPIGVSNYRAVVLGLKGDGRTYQLRVAAEPGARHAYACDFQTSGCWQTVKIPFSALTVIPRGTHLEPPSYPGQVLAQIQLLAANGAPESFRLEIDKIWLE